MGTPSYYTSPEANAAARTSITAPEARPICVLIRGVIRAR